MLVVAACINGETASFGISYKEALGSLLLPASMTKSIVNFGICHK